MDFKKFREAVAAQFVLISQHQLFTTMASKDMLWDTYLDSFPEGTNPKYIERSEHDCTCCKQFIRAVGNVVAIIDGKIVSIWDIKLEEPADTPYQVVANALSTVVKLFEIDNIFLHDQKTAGTFQNRSLVKPTNAVKVWDHFFVNIPSKFVKKSEEIGKELGTSTADFEVFRRGLVELELNALDIVIDLVKQNSLYRGEENLYALENFRLMKLAVTNVKNINLFVWQSLSLDIPASVVHFRNTAIGTLVTDISEGVDLEQAVRMFESKVAPINYKRPTAVVTKAMIDLAKDKIEKLGLMSSLERRYAKESDIEVSNLLFADRKASIEISGNIFDKLSSKASDSVLNGPMDSITIDKFINDVLPTATSVELLLENSHINKMMSLVTAVDPTSGGLFKWANLFSWSYNGDVTDSIKEKVKAAGGNVEGDVSCRLAWFNHDDLDLAVVEPDQTKIYFGNKRPHNSSGHLDIDMNAGGGQTMTPVENIFYPEMIAMKEGIYKVVVTNYSQRSFENSGFEIEFDVLGTIYSMSAQTSMKGGTSNVVIEFEYSRVSGIQVLNQMKVKSLSKDIWGIDTGTLHKVKFVMNSPNYWGGDAVGNKHTFFILDKCSNPEPTRGFYNEFLATEFNENRKAFELVGSNLKTPTSTEQLSGVGFSSTQKDKVVLVVNGSFKRAIEVTF